MKKLKFVDYNVLVLRDRLTEDIAEEVKSVVDPCL